MQVVQVFNDHSIAVSRRHVHIIINQKGFKNYYPKSFYVIPDYKTTIIIHLVIHTVTLSQPYKRWKRCIKNFTIAFDAIF